MSDPNAPLRLRIKDGVKGAIPCRYALDWMGDRTLAEAWRDCDRADWMLWLAGRLVPLPVLVRCNVAYVREIALPHVRAGEDRPWYATEVALAWCDGRATLVEVRAAAAYAAAYAADAWATAHAAAYAAYDAYAADDADDAAYAAYDAYDAAYAADAAAYAAYAYAAYAAYANCTISVPGRAGTVEKASARIREIIREHITPAMLEEGLG